MTAKSDLRRLVRKFDADLPRNAVALRAASDAIISKWINLKFEYPDDLMDDFVYIESSIERIMHEFNEKPLELHMNLLEIYSFHIDSFKESLEKLIAFCESDA